MSDALLARLAAAAGILPDYWTLAGELRVTSPETMRAVLSAMGYPAGTTADIRESLLRHERARWERLLPAATVTRGGPVAITVPGALSARTAQWRIVCEDGSILHGACDLVHTAPTAAEALDGSAFARYDLTLPPLSTGYHRLTLDIGPETATGALIAAPKSSYCPAWLARGERLWGIACHLYSLRSRRNWGVGDFSDLAAVGALTAACGGAVVAINPLHALFTERPDCASPYWPSSRVFLNPIYLDLTRIPELPADPVAPEVSDRIAALNAAPLIDYPDVAKVKFALLRKLAPVFEAQPLPARDAFVAAGGAPLRQFAIFSALGEHFAGRPWTAWPAAYRDPASPAVTRWAADHSADVRFHVLLQWLADRQLGQAADAVRGAEIGLMRDLAVGVSADGADVWSSPALYSAGARFGAPPDRFAPQGQDWGLPPPIPHRLKDMAYAPFVAAVRANMRHAGALRIDHVMALDRLFWIPPGADARSGAYVRYPLDDMLGLLALESVRARCLVVGEDLGTVPEGFRERMEKEHVLSTRLFYFERYPNGLFKRPELYPRHSVAQGTTHDAPPLAAFWLEKDIALRASLDSRFDVEAAKQDRMRTRGDILGALADQGLLPDGETTIEDLIVAIHRFLARAPSCLAMVNLGDAMAAVEQVNVPGTHMEYPNWRTKLPVLLEDLGGSRPWLEMAQAMNAERGTP
jgi:4-alpha-glucanotransferase